MKDELAGLTVKGSNAKGWMKAYRALLSKLETMKKVPPPLTIQQVMYLKGYEDAVNEFRHHTLKPR